MAVPSKFTPKQVAETRRFLTDHVKKNGRIIRGSVHGNIFVTYQTVSLHLDPTYTIDNEWEGDFVGDLVGEVSYEDHLVGKPLISAIVIRAANTANLNTAKMASLIGLGFFKLGMSLGFIPEKSRIDPNGLDELTFWNNQLLAIVHAYGVNKP